MFRDNVKEKHDFLCINYSNNTDNLYLNKDFQPLAEPIEVNKLDNIEKEKIVATTV